MFQRILVPLDESKHAELAVAAAARLARASGGSIVLVHVAIPTAAIASHGHDTHVATMQDPESTTHARLYLKSIMQKYAHELSNIPVEADLETGSSSTGIMSAASSNHADLVVICLQENTFFNHWLFKHMPLYAIRHSTVPMLLLNEQGKLLVEPNVTHPFHVLIPLDGSAIAEAVLEPCAQLLMSLVRPEQQIIIQLLDIIEPLPKGDHGQSAQASYQRTRDEAAAYLKTVAESIQREWPIKVTVISSILANTEVPATILHQAERVVDSHAPDGCDLIAMATHSREGIQRLMQRSVTEHVLGSTKFPLLVVTPDLLQNHGMHS